MLRKCWNNARKALSPDCFDGAFYLTNGGENKLKALMIWGGCPLPESGEPTVMVFKGSDGSPILTDLDSDGSFSSLFLNRPIHQFPWPPLLEIAREAMVKDHHGNRQTVRDLVASCKKQGKVLGLLFSGKWCYWCRDFRPKLAKVYNSYKGTELEFEILFCSSDQSSQEMEDFYLEMPWIALDWKYQDIKERLEEEFGVQGIPSLIFFDSEGTILTKDGCHPIRSG